MLAGIAECRHARLATLSALCLNILSVDGIVAICWYCLVLTDLETKGSLTHKGRRESVRMWAWSDYHCRQQMANMSFRVTAVGS